MEEEKQRPVSKIINHSFMRDMCHERDMKISEDALIEIAKNTWSIVIRCIEDTKDVKGKLILKRQVEGVL